MLVTAVYPIYIPLNRKGIYQSRHVPFAWYSSNTSFSLMLYGTNAALSLLRSRGVEAGPSKACDNALAQCDRGAVSVMS